MGLRVVSLLPSATEIVCLVAAQCSADAAPQLVGRSHECDYPAGLAHLPVLTAAKTSFTDSADVDRQVREALSSGSGLYTVDRALLQQLQPDVIVTQARRRRRRRSASLCRSGAQRCAAGHCHACPGLTEAVCTAPMYCPAVALQRVQRRLVPGAAYR